MEKDFCNLEAQLRRIHHLGKGSDTYAALVKTVVNGLSTHNKQCSTSSHAGLQGPCRQKQAPWATDSCPANESGKTPTWCATRCRTNSFWPSSQHHGKQEREAGAQVEPQRSKQRGWGKAPLAAFASFSLLCVLCSWKPLKALLNRCHLLLSLMMPFWNCFLGLIFVQQSVLTTFPFVKGKLAPKCWLVIWSCFYKVLGQGYLAHQIENCNHSPS